jgi:hypothetical protein
MSKNDGGPAFPKIETKKQYTTDIDVHSVGGMSIRDYFAAKIFAAMIAGGHWPIDATSEDQARMAYKHADAMLLERAK